jgi:hypothetical protein
MSPDGGEDEGPAPAGVALAAIAAWAIELALARRVAVDLVAILVSVALALASMIAAGFVWQSARKVAITSMVFAAALAAFTTKDPGLHLMTGVKCMFLELAAAAMPLAVVAWTGRAQRGPHVAAAMAAAAAAGALAGDAAMHLACPVASARAHAVIFHFGGVALAAALALRLSRASRRP